MSMYLCESSILANKRSIQNETALLGLFWLLDEQREEGRACAWRTIWELNVEERCTQDLKTLAIYDK